MAKVTKAQLRHVADGVTDKQMIEILARFFCRTSVLVLKRDEKFPSAGNIASYAHDVLAGSKILWDVGEVIDNVSTDYEKKPPARITGPLKRGRLEGRMRYYREVALMELRAGDEVDQGVVVRVSKKNEAPSAATRIVFLEEGQYVESVGAKVRVWE